MRKEVSADPVVKDIRRRTRRRYSAEEKIGIVSEGLGGEGSIAEACRREGLPRRPYSPWGREFPEAGKRRLQGDTAWEATSHEVTDLRKENARLKQPAAKVMLENRVLKKSLPVSG